MSPLTLTSPEVEELYAEAKLLGVEISRSRAWKLLSHVGNRRLCIDALLLNKRPKWLTEIVGKKK